MGDNIIYTLQGGKMVKINEPDNPEKANFVIICEYGDWSGFRTLADCESQFVELENRDKPNGWFSVVER